MKNPAASADVKLVFSKKRKFPLIQRTFSWNNGKDSNNGEQSMSQENLMVIDPLRFFPEKSDWM